MASINNIYLMITTPAFKKYKKTIPSILSGKRLDYDGAKPTEFVLQSNPDVFDYEAEILELYSDKEDRYFRQANKGLIQEGLIQEWVGELPEIDTTNFLSDTEINEIATIRTIPALTKRLAELTSPFAVNRVKTVAETIGRPVKILQVIESRLKELTKDN